MNSKLLTIVIVAIVAVGGGAAILKGSQNEANVNPESATNRSAMPQADSSQQSSSSTTSSSDEVQEGTATVNISDFKFGPQNLKVKKSTKVTWVNQDTAGHNVIAPDGQVKPGGPPADNEIFRKGDTYDFTFNTVGSFDYICRPHPYMKGKVEVVE